MLADITLEEARELIGKHSIVFSETVIPREVDLLPHSPYRPEYSWLFPLERRLGRLLDQWLSHYRKDLIGPGGLLSEALSNAYCHGHKRNAKMAIHIRIAVGEQGLLICIEDSGEGFDFHEVARTFASKRLYFHNAGRGLLRAIKVQDFAVFFTDKGRTFNLLYLNGKALGKLRTVLPRDQNVKNE
jgi:hypothetical protein